MKRITCCILLLSLFLTGFSQNCEQREKKLLVISGGFSAGFIYNSYLLTSTLKAGYEKKVFNKEAVNTVLTEQNRVFDNLSSMLKEVLDENAIVDDGDKRYFEEMITAVKSLKAQAQYLSDFVLEKPDSSMEKYDKQRKLSWELISKLLGLEDNTQAK